MRRECHAIVGAYDVGSHVDSAFLQMFLWKGFGALAPKPIGYSTTVPLETGGMVSPTGAKSLKQFSGKTLANAIDEEENFNLRLYTSFLQGSTGSKHSGPRL